MRNLKLVFAVLLLALIFVGCSDSNDVEQIDSEEQVINLQPIETVAVIKQINLEENQIIFVGVDDGTEYNLVYSGGVDVTDKFGDILSASQLKPGQVVDASYNASNYKLTAIHINEDSWEYNKQSKVSIDSSNFTLNTKEGEYKYDSNLLVFSDGKLIEMSELCSEDEVTLRGYKGKLCSVSVDYGHGYVLLSDYDTYIDGMIEIGYDVIVPVTESMLLTVREGDYKLKITKGKNTGYKNITVVKNEQTEVSLKEIQIEPASTGKVKFTISPEGSRVYIDGELIDISSDYETIYGLHRIKIYADGYTTYSGYFKVSDPYKTRSYTLIAEAAESDDSKTGTAEDDSSDSKVTNNTVTIESPSGVYLYVDGEYIGETPATFSKTIGTHTITFTKTGYITKSYTITCTNNGQDDTYSYDDLKLISDSVE